METTTVSFFKQMEDTYGLQTKLLMKKYIITQRKLLSLRARKNFLIDCRRHKIVPKSLKIDLKGFKYCIKDEVRERLGKNFSNTIQNEAIRELYTKMTSIECTINNCAKAIQEIVPVELWKEFYERVKTKSKSNFDKRTSKLNMKLNKLIEPTIQQCNKQDKWLKNLTDTTIPKPVENILGLGNKFNLKVPNEKMPAAKIIASLEPMIQNLPQTAERIELRNKLCNILTNHKKARTKNNSMDVILNEHFKITKEFIRMNPEIIVLNADKGNVTVLLPKEQYINKMEMLLQDRKTYVVLEKDPTNKIEAQCNLVISTWKNQRHITDREAKKLRRYNSHLARMYGQVKIHKEGNPLRPIVDCINSPTYNLSKMYADILKNVTGNTRKSVRNSFEFKEKINDTVLPEGYVLVSLDVVSLFTNIPNDLVYKAVDKRWFQIRKFTNLPKSEFLKGLKVVLENCTFSFNNVIYHQIFGTPMGSPVSPVVADLVMEMIEDEIMKKSTIRTPFYYRYVDDSCTACPAKRTEELKNTFNSINEHIQFTMEIEKDKQIAFLDTLLIRDDDGFIKTNWYHKDTWSGRYLNFHSSMPFSYKKNTITILTQRMLRLSSPTFYRENCDLIKDTLMLNNYPMKLLDTVINECINNHNKPKDKKEKTDTRYVSVPYISGLFEKIKTTFRQYNIQVVGKGDNTLQQKLFTKLKDQIPKHLQSGLIYEVKCSCNDVYIGQTIQRLHKRLEGHQYNIRTKNAKHSALCEHIIETNHTVNWDDVRILCKEPKKHNRDVMEMIAIKTTTNVINKQQECKFLSNTYNNIIQGTFHDNETHHQR